MHLFSRNTKICLKLYKNCIKNMFQPVFATQTQMCVVHLVTDTINKKYWDSYYISDTCINTYCSHHFLCHLNPFWKWEITSTSNTLLFAFRWKKQQGYLDNCGPNGGAMVKHLTIKQFNYVLWVSFSGKLIQFTESSETPIDIYSPSKKVMLFIL